VNFRLGFMQAKKSIGQCSGNSTLNQLSESGLASGLKRTVFGYYIKKEFEKHGIQNFLFRDKEKYFIQIPEEQVDSLLFSKKLSFENYTLEELKEAAETLKTLIYYNPYCDEAYKQLIKLLIRLDDLMQAKQYYEKYYTIMKEEFGILIEEKAYFD
jgi:hypothetical protein